ncbi:MAG: helicase C-terminal domain-containing protein [Clostridia bacterium]
MDTEERPQAVEAAFRVSVRDLVAFSYFPADIMPGTDMRELWAGTQAHQARQRGQEGQAERAIKHRFALNGESVLVYGRMDAFTEGDVPFVEEIKLGSGEEPSARSEHRAQALCYAAMVAQEQPCAAVRFAVSYVNLQGKVLRVFSETLENELLLAQMNALLAPYIAFAVRERAHRERRDASLRALPFPFERYRAGQRELAAQVYTAIVRGKRLVASLPTGTGKSAAVLYPALKAMGEGKTRKILYLTARNTARQSPLNALERMHAQGMRARCATLTAKEKLCPTLARCHPDACSRAKGHYLRQSAAIDELLLVDCPCWTDEVIMQAADRHEVCPFELALALVELADVVLMDLNYIFDPFAQIKRLNHRHTTLLVDEAHHAVDRVRESLSGELNSSVLVKARAGFGKVVGRRHAYYLALGRLIAALRALGCEGGTEENAPAPHSPAEALTLPTLPPALPAAAQAVLDEALALFHHPVSSGEQMSEISAVVRLCLPFLYAAEHLDEDYAILLEKHGKERTLTLYCLLPAKEMERQTKPMRGVVYFSATLAPLPAMRQLLGGAEGDACFSLPSPFPPQRLAVVRRSISTRYEGREASAAQVAGSIAEAVTARRGKYIAYFPSYAYLALVLEHLVQEELPALWVQRRDMTDDDRAAFLAAFVSDSAPKLGLCVLGGLFSEGIDLPGEQLIGVIIVGMGLATPSAKLRAVQACYERHFGDGFGYACRIPAMQKVAQAGGRVIRDEQDRGLVLLLDERYYRREYASLLPPEWQLQNENITAAVKRLEAME